MKQGEVGRRIYCDTDFDMSANSGITIILTKPDGSSVSKAAILGTVDYTTSSGTVFAANEYAYYDTEAGVIDQLGVWDAHVKYDDATPKTYYSDRAQFTVESV